ncbi:hypothetical protein DFH07DRAFT_1065926 [Mycena maculata]|uniref:Zn(2)-C6 fungal-type domain-containing protein n=1 Tax=Mycena maculata TaxID=230809 RepID=A0AAD7HYL8_9AGAR|nr:hypothetical protein DFH07DRAFT_1065926 [Mycena maculata]
MSLPMEESVASERPYRSRKNRPCDRCRSRKQRCITKPSGTCLNCQISGVPCTFDSPAAADIPRPRNKKAETKSKTGNGIADASSSRPLSRSYTSSGYTSPSISMASPSVKLERHNSLRLDVTSPLTSPRLELGGAFSNIVLHCDPPGLASAMSESPNSNVSEEEYRALDSDADDDFEPHYVGETAERDALVLSALATVHSTTKNGSTPPQSTPFRVRQVSTNQAEPVFFLFERTRPYGEDNVGKYTSAELIGLLGPNNIHRLLQHYLRMDGHAVPIWRATDFSDNPEQRLPAGLFCAYVSRGVIYDDQLRHLAAEAWKITTLTNRAQSRSARVSTIQANLLDLDGRPSLNPTGNSMLLGQTIAAGRLMGLHLPCEHWLIPKWEKSLRVKLWWAVLQQDKWSALCYGRSSYIQYGDWDVPLPPFEVTNDFTFVALCELTLILDRILQKLNVVRPSCRPDDARETLTTISNFGLELDTWKHRLDSMGQSLNGYLIPGFRSLQLSYLAVALLLVRCVLDLDLPLAAARSAYDSALRVAEEVVEFTASLTPDDLRGYFTTHSAFHFSTCLILLVRLVLQADLADQSDGAAWQRVLHQLRIFISALSNAKKSVPSFELGDLALARARHLIPLLAKNIPALAMALEPFWQVLLFLSHISAIAYFSPFSPPVEESVTDVTNSYHSPVTWPENGPGLESFFPEVTQPDWISFRDYIHTPYSQMLNPSYGLQ